jgi:hypothetical protein
MNVSMRTLWRHRPATAQHMSLRDYARLRAEAKCPVAIEWMRRKRMRPLSAEEQTRRTAQQDRLLEAAERNAERERRARMGTGETGESAEGEGDA